MQYLKLNNKFYSDIEIDLKNIEPELLNIENNRNSEPEPDCNLQSSKDDIKENSSDPLNDFKQSVAESIVLPPSHTNEYLEIAPGEGKKPENIILDKFCEELAFPQLLCKGRYGYSVDRNLKISHTKYFNQRLLNYKNIFSSCSEYIFFAQFVMQQINLNSQINIAMKKVPGSSITAASIQQQDSCKNLIANDRCYYFMNRIKGVPAYWKRFQFEVLAMVRQLGCPSFFMTLSSADLHWPELISIISKMSRNPISSENIDKLNYFERCKLLNENPVFVARHFQYRVEL